MQKMKKRRSEVRRPSSGTPHSCQAQGAPLAPGEWPRVYSGYLPLFILTGKPTGVNFAADRNGGNALSRSCYGCSCHSCCHVRITQVCKLGDETDDLADT